MKRTGKYLLAALVSVATFAVYLPALKNDFLIWDDEKFILNNSHIRSLGENFFRWAFTDMSLDFWYPLGRFRVRGGCFLHSSRRCRLSL